MFRWILHALRGAPDARLEVVFLPGPKLNRLWPMVSRTVEDVELGPALDGAPPPEDAMPAIRWSPSGDGGLFSASHLAGSPIVLVEAGLAAAHARFLRHGFRHARFVLVGEASEVGLAKRRLGTNRCEGVTMWQALHALGVPLRERTLVLGLRSPERAPAWPQPASDPNVWWAWRNRDPHEATLLAILGRVPIAATAVPSSGAIRPVEPRLAKWFGQPLDAVHPTVRHWSFRIRESALDRAMSAWLAEIARSAEGGIGVVLVRAECGYLVVLATAEGGPAMWMAFRDRAGRAHRLGGAHWDDWPQVSKVFLAHGGGLHSTEDPTLRSGAMHFAWLPLVDRTVGVVRGDDPRLHAGATVDEARRQFA